MLSNEDRLDWAENVHRMPPRGESIEVSPIIIVAFVAIAMFAIAWIA